MGSETSLSNQPQHRQLCSRNTAFGFPKRNRLLGWCGNAGIPIGLFWLREARSPTLATSVPSNMQWQSAFVGILKRKSPFLSRRKVARLLRSFGALGSEKAPRQPKCSGLALLRCSNHVAGSLPGAEQSGVGELFPPAQAVLWGPLLPLYAPRLASCGGTVSPTLVSLTHAVLLGEVM